MGAPSAQVQSSQSSAPASKGAGTSASTPSGSGKGSMAATSGQPTMGSPNTNGNTGMTPVNPNFVSPVDGSTGGNPYPNTVGPILDSTVSGSPKQATGQLGINNALNNMGSVAGGPNGQPMAKGGGGGQGGGKGVASAAGTGKSINDPMGMIENTYHPNAGPQGPGSSY